MRNEVENDYVLEYDGDEEIEMGNINFIRGLQYEAQNDLEMLEIVKRMSESGEGPLSKEDC